MPGVGPGAEPDCGWLCLGCGGLPGRGVYRLPVSAACVSVGPGWSDAAPGGLQIERGSRGRA